MKYTKEKMLMIEIKIESDENRNVIFIIDNIEYQFNYDGFEKVIDLVLKSEKIKCTNSNDDLKKYKVLLEDIIDGAKQQDFKDAVAKAKQNTATLEELEKQYSEQQ